MRVLTKIRPRELTGSRAIVASLVGTAVTAACAQIAVHLPGNPVPVTMQVFAVLCCGLMLGSKYGMLSQLEYVALGLMGAPVFAGFTGGPAAFWGPSGGYLIGFIAAAWAVGKFMELASEKNFGSALQASLLGVTMIYAFGAAWLAIWLKIFDPKAGMWIGWMLGTLPFAGVDIAKSVLAAIVCFGRPKY